MDLPSRSIVALLEPARRISPTYEANPQYFPNMSGKIKIKKAQRATSSLGKGMRLEMTRVAFQPMSRLNTHVCPILHCVLDGDRPRARKMSSDLRGRATPERISYWGPTWPLFYVVYGTEYRVLDMYIQTL